MKGKIFLLIFVFLMTTLSLENLYSKSSEKYIQEAKKSLDAGRKDLADKIMEQMIQEYPTHKYALKYKATKLANAGKIEEAYGVFQEIVKYYPDYALGYMYLGKLERLLGNDVKGKMFLEKAIQLDPTCQAHAGLGGLYYDQGKYEEAVKELNLYLEHNEHTEEVYLVLGEAYTKLGKYEEAINAYQKGREIGDPRNPVLLLKIGKAYEKLEQWENAVRIYKLANRWHSYDEEVRESLKCAEKMSLEHPSKIEEPTLDYKGYKPSEDQATEQK